MFNILTYGKRNNVNIGILPLYNTLGVDWKDSLDKYDLFNFVSLKRMKPNVKYTVFITFNGHFKTTDGVHPLYDCQELPNPDQVDTRNNLIQ